MEVTFHFDFLFIIFPLGLSLIHIYEAINASNGAGESTVFIEFMLSAIKASLIDAVNTNDEMSDGKIDKVTLRWHKIQEYLKTHDYFMNADVRELCGVSDVYKRQHTGALCFRYKMSACRSAVSARSQNGSEFFAPLGVVLATRFVTSLSASLSLRR